MALDSVLFSKHAIDKQGPNQGFAFNASTFTTVSPSAQQKGLLNTAVNIKQILPPAREFPSGDCEDHWAYTEICFSHWGVG